MAVGVRATFCSFASANQLPQGKEVRATRASARLPLPGEWGLIHQGMRVRAERDGVTTAWMQEVEQRMEQLPRAADGMCHFI